MDKHKKKALYLIRIMGVELAKRFVNTKIEHWESNEFADIRTKTKGYWQNIKDYIV